jgi:magnesium-transporting ATPase (P-type)
MDLLIASIIAMVFVAAARYFPWHRILRRAAPNVLQYAFLAIIWASIVTVLMSMWQWGMPAWAIKLNIPIMGLLELVIWTVGLTVLVTFAALEFLDNSLDNRDRMTIAETDGERLRDGLKK